MAETFDVSELAGIADRRNRRWNAVWLVALIAVPVAMVVTAIEFLLFVNAARNPPIPFWAAVALILGWLLLFLPGMLLIFGRPYRDAAPRPHQVSVDSSGIEFEWPSGKTSKYRWNDKWRWASLEDHHRRPMVEPKSPELEYVLYVSEPSWGALLAAYRRIGKVPLTKLQFDEILAIAMRSGVVIERLWPGGITVGDGPPTELRFPRRDGLRVPPAE
jgi:hypothetical protein